MKYIIDTTKKKAVISKNIYGHFSEHLGRCIYEGIFVGEDSPIPNTDGMRNDILEVLRAMKLPVLRWPGGCFADEYHWKDGIGPKEKRKKMINTHWGGVIEDNSFGTHEFLRFCELVGCEPFISGNVGSGTVQEMSEWVEYMSFGGLSPMAKLREENGRKEPWKVKYFGIGNENWGCGGNMTAEYYADIYRNFSTFVRNYGNNKVFKIACGPNSDDYHWSKTLMEKAGNCIDGLSLHYYTVAGDNWKDKGSATGFSDDEYYKTMKKTLHMKKLITMHSAIMDIYDPDKKVALIIDEWGTWHAVEEGTNPGFLYQQNTMRDALVAGINLNLFNKHAERVKMANIAQLVNVLQSIILTEGSEMILTPTYHVFEMYSDHQENELVDSHILSGVTGTKDNQVPDIIESASIDIDGHLVMTLCNLDLKNSKDIDVCIPSFHVKSAFGEILTGDKNDHNTFSDPELVKKKKIKKISFTEEGILFTIPPCSVAKVVVSG